MALNVKKKINKQTAYQKTTVYGPKRPHFSYHIQYYLYNVYLRMFEENKWDSFKRGILLDHKFTFDPIFKYSVADRERNKNLQISEGCIRRST